jgi:AcrR family transcriptional regulator
LHQDRNRDSILDVPYRPTERTEARRARIRARIGAAALRLVAEGGYQAAAISSVAQAAGVGAGTVYRHFPSKADLLAEVFRVASQREVDAVAASVAVPGPATRRLAAAVETFARRALRGRRLAWALLAEPVDPAVEAERLVFRRAYRDLFAAVLEEGIASGELAGQDAELTAAALVGAIGEALVGPLSPSAAAGDPDRLVRDLVTFCLRSATDEEATDVHAHAA